MNSGTSRAQQQLAFKIALLSLGAKIQPVTCFRHQSPLLDVVSGDLVKAMQEVCDSRGLNPS